jgi:hypothetical protein
MITLKKTVFVLLLTVASTLSFVACKKNNTVANTDTESAENNALSESTFNDVTTLVDQSITTGDIIVGQAGSTAANNAAEEALGSSCATISLDTVSNRRAVIIDFGTTNCLCKDGRYRRGKILTNYTGRYRDSGTVVSITFDNYFVNDNQITGTKTITNNGINAAGHLVYTVQVDGVIIKANNGGRVTWASTRQREWIAGANTPLVLTDDVYSITGSASGTNAAGDSYSIKILQPLIRSMSCKWFESGKCEITKSNNPTVILDYGTTGCDANATATVAGKTYDIVLK